MYVRLKSNVRPRDIWWFPTFLPKEFLKWYKKWKHKPIPMIRKETYPPTFHLTGEAMRDWKRLNPMVDPPTFPRSQIDKDLEPIDLIKIRLMNME